MYLMPTNHLDKLNSAFVSRLLYRSLVLSIELPSIPNE